MNDHVDLNAYCLECDGPLHLVAEGGTRFERRAAMECRDCGSRYVVVVRIVPDDASRVARCGTTGGYAAHRRRNENPCTACKEANARMGDARRKAS